MLRLLWVISKNVVLSCLASWIRTCQYDIAWPIKWGFPVKWGVPVGGVPVKSGVPVKWGVLVKSSNLNWWPANELTKLITNFVYYLSISSSICYGYLLGVSSLICYGCPLGVSWLRWHVWYMVFRQSAPSLDTVYSTIPCAYSHPWLTMSEVFR